MTSQIARDGIMCLLSHQCEKYERAMLAATHDWSADHCRLPPSLNNDSSRAPAPPANTREFRVGRWTITVAECGDDMLRLAIASLADPANPVQLATLPDQDMSTVTVLAANSANKRKWPCMGKNENEERTANAKRSRVEKNEDEEKNEDKARAPRRQRPVIHTRPSSSPPVVEEAAGFSCLPDEVKLHVFTMLQPMTLLRAVPLVSREWCALAHDDALWRALYLRHIGGSSPSPSTMLSAPSLQPAPDIPTRRQHSTPSPPTSTSTTWRGSTSLVLRQLKAAFADLRRSLRDLAERQRRESEARMSSWLAHTVEWMVDGDHAPLLAAFLRDVTRFAPGSVIRATLAADRRLLLGAAKSGHTGAVTTLVAFGADLGQAMVLATMNRDAAGIAGLFRAYVHIKTVLCAEYRRQQAAKPIATATLTENRVEQRATHGRRLFGLVAGVRDAMRTCMNVASVARDRELLEMLANLCASDADLREAHEFAHFVKFEGPFSARGRRRSQAYGEDDYDDDESDPEYEEEEGEDSDGEVEM